MFFRINLFLFSFLLALPIVASAESGERPTIVDRPETFSDGATFGIIGKANHSYVCMLAAFSENELTLSTEVTTPSGAVISGSRPSNVDDARRYLSANYGSGVGGTKARDNLVFFTAPNGEDEFGKYVLTIGVSDGPARSVGINCLDTTTVCAFNTVASDFNFLEVTSFGNTDGVANLSTLNFDGTLNTTSSPAIFSAGTRRDFDVHSLAGPGAFGTLFIQALNFIPSLDSFADPKVSTYKDNELTSSLSCSPELSDKFFGGR